MKYCKMVFLCGLLMLVLLFGGINFSHAMKLRYANMGQDRFTHILDSSKYTFTYNFSVRIAYKGWFETVNYADSPMGFMIEENEEMIIYRLHYGGFLVSYTYPPYVKRVVTITNRSGWFQAPNGTVFSLGYCYGFVSYGVEEAAFIISNLVFVALHWLEIKGTVGLKGALRISSCLFVSGGLISVIYVFSGFNLFTAILLHSLINTTPILLEYINLPKIFKKL